MCPGYRRIFNSAAKPDSSAERLRTAEKVQVTNPRRLRKRRRGKHPRWSLLLRLLDLKFPTLWARLSDEQRRQIKEILRPGDILLEDDGSYPLWQVASRMIGSRWSHSGIYAGDNIVIDAGTKPFVAKIDLDQFLDTTDIAVYRPRYDSAADLDSTLQYVIGCLGRPFNQTFDYNSQTSFYCAQLLSRALEQMPNPIVLPTRCLFGKRLVVPSGIEQCSDLTLIWIARKGLLSSVISHCPILVPALIGALCGAGFGAPYALLGATVALTASLFLGNFLMHQFDGKLGCNPKGIATDKSFKSRYTSL